MCIRCVSNMLTVPGATRSLISGGGGYARDGKYYRKRAILVKLGKKKTKG